MAEIEDHDEVGQLNRLLKLAQGQDQASRRVVFENMVDLFLSAEGRLSDRERALMTGIIGQLLHEMEMKLRRDLAQRLSALDAGPHELIVALANDEIEVARPILIASKVLSDSDLIEVVRHRSNEHQLAVAMRGPLSADVAQALIDQGEENVIESLLKNRDATLSRRALEYLVAEAQRVGRFQEPVLTRPELPPDLAHRLFWYVSAALRAYVLDKFTLDEATIDDFVQDSARAVLAEPLLPTADRQAAALVERLAEADELNDRFLVGALRGGKIAAFVAGMAKLTRLNVLMVRRILYDPSPEGLAVLCRAVGIDRSAFGSIFLLTRQGTTRVVKPEIVNKVMAFYDQMSPQRAKTALRYWRADRDYLHATAKLAEIRSARVMRRTVQARAVVPVGVEERPTPLIGPADGGGTALGGVSLQDALARVVLNELSPIFIAYLDHNQFYANNSYLRLYGLARHDRKRLADHLETLQDEVEETLKRLSERSSHLTAQRSVPASIGPSHYRVQYFPIFDTRDRLVALGGVYYDITLQVETVERLRVAQQTFNDVLRSTSDWVWETGVDGRLTFVSERIVEAVGEPTALLMGRQLSDLLAPCGREDAAPIAELLEQRQPFRDRVFELRGGDGRSYPHRLSGVPVFDLSSGRFSGFRGTGSDITAQAAAEEASAESRRNLETALQELNRKNESLDQALEKSHAAARAKNEFLANMSHELRTPLNAIIGFAEVISERTFGDDPVRYAAYAADIKRAGWHLLQIISDVLDLSRIESNKLAVDIGAVQLSAILDEAKALIVKQARDKGIDLAGMALSRNYVLRADRTRALQILINLLTNAVKFTPTGGAIGINTAAVDGGNAVDITVWDTGPGIPPDKQAAIFDAFYQIQDKAYTRGHEGLGLGLSIARHLARVMGGDIKVLSLPGHGSRFVVRLPLAVETRG